MHVYTRTHAASAMSRILSRSGVERERPSLALARRASVVRNRCERDSLPKRGGDPANPKRRQPFINSREISFIKERERGRERSVIRTSASRRVSGGLLHRAICRRFQGYNSTRLTNISRAFSGRSSNAELRRRSAEGAPVSAAVVGARL